MHAVTAVSGSGPAYVFHVIEALAAAGVRAGLPEELAMRLARATVVGAGELAFRSEDSAARSCARMSPAPAARQRPRSRCSWRPTGWDR